MRSLGAAPLLLLACSLPAALTLAAEFPQPGEWPCFRRDGGLLARSPARGRISEPRIVWKQFIGTLDTELIAEPGKGTAKCSLAIDESGVGAAEFAEARARFFRNDVSAQTSGAPADPVTTVFADVLPDEPGLEKIEFESGFAKPTVQGQWQTCVGRCFAQRSGQWVQAWETAPIDLLFQPLPLAGDFDGDGSVEIAILPFHELILLEGRTGRIKSRCRFTETRSYGFFGAYDFDHDGRAEFLVMGDFSKHVDVLGFREGKLSVLWQRAIELDISNPQKVLRVGPQPIADVDGDGHEEILINLFNDTGDARWHLSVCDALTGRVKCELPDEQLAGVADLDGDGASELLTIRSQGAATPDFGVISVWSIRNATVRRRWTRDHAAWQMWDGPLPVNVKSTATLGRRTALQRAVGGRQALVFRERAGAASVTLREVVWAGEEFSTRLKVTGRDLEATALDSAGRMLMRCRHAPGVPVTVSATGAQLMVAETKRAGLSPAPVAVAWPVGAVRPTIVVPGAGEEIVTFEPPLAGAAAANLRRIRGRGQSTQWPEARGAVIADLFGDGRRQLLMATAAPDGTARFVATDLRGGELWHHDFPGIPGGAPIWNMGGIVLWQAGHFTADRPARGFLGRSRKPPSTPAASNVGRPAPRHQDVLVTVRRSMMHSEETYLLAGEDGRALWHRDRQVSHRGVGGAPFALADFNGDGLDDACSLNPSILYILEGATGRDLLARDATWPEVPAQPVYWGVPAAGDFLGAGRPAIFFGGRSMTGLIRADGSLTWWDALDQSAPGWPAFGDFDGDGHMQSMGVGYDDGVRCYDLVSGKVKWRLPVPVAGSLAGCASGDLDGGGRDEAVFVMGQELVCLGSVNGAGVVKWKLRLPAPCGPPALAILDPGGSVSVLLAGSDGYVYCVR
jgi:hypothetical protein